jgi:hypothetical protein
MVYICPDCGAKDIGNGSCRDFFDSFLNLEFTDPSYGEVHIFTVGTYMVQHYHYSDVALVWICDNFKRHLLGDRTTEDMRKDDPGILNGGLKKTKILRLSSDPPLPRFKWKMTIADVAEKYENAKNYRELVREWTYCTLLQMENSPDGKFDPV